MDMIPTIIDGRIIGYTDDAGRLINPDPDSDPDFNSGHVLGRRPRFLVTWSMYGPVDAAGPREAARAVWRRVFTRAHDPVPFEADPSVFDVLDRRDGRTVRVDLVEPDDPWTPTLA